MFSAKNVFESILSMDCPLVHGLSPVRPWSVHAQVWMGFSYVSFVPSRHQNIIIATHAFPSAAFSCHFPRYDQENLR